MKQIIIFLVLFHVLITASYSQNYTLPEVVAQTPNTAELEKYGEYPVGHYSGVANINIPLYTIESGDIKIPISLSYHASGIKLAQEASWVGLGWSLNAGGTISKQTKGADDFGGWKNRSLNRYFYRGSIIPLEQKNIEDRSTFTAAQKVQYGGNSISLKQDFLPDLYFYNFVGNSGQMVWDDYPNGVPVNRGSGLVFKSHISMNSNGNLIDGALEAINTNGIHYEFDFREENYSISRKRLNCDGVCPEISSFKFGAWHLTSVNSTKGDQVNFKYKKYQNSFIESPTKLISVRHSVGGSTIRSTKNGEVLSSHQHLNMYTNLLHTYYKIGREKSINSKSWTQNFYLERINFAEGYVLFHCDDRKDLKTVNSDEKSKKLRYLEVYNLQNQLVKGYKFDYSYFHGSNTIINPNISKLKLNQISEYHIIDKDTISKKPYSFEYNTHSSLSLQSTENLKKNSWAIDPWGYPTRDYGIPSVSLDPPKNSNPIGTVHVLEDDIIHSEPRFTLNRGHQLQTDDVINQRVKPWYYYRGVYNYLQRSADTIANQLNSLKKINYPTGGASEFIYETNDHITDYIVRKNLFEIHESTQLLEVPGNFITNNCEQEDCFYPLPRKGPYFRNKATHLNIFIDYFKIASRSAEGIPEKTFTIDNRIIVPFQFKYQPYDRDINQGTDVYAVLENSAGKQVALFGHNQDFERTLPNNTPSNISLYETIYWLDLPADTYTMKFINLKNKNIYIALNILELNDYEIVDKKNKFKGGGLRIKEIKNLDATNDVLKKTTYSYKNTNGKSSGKLMAPVNYEYYKCFDTFKAVKELFGAGFKSTGSKLFLDHYVNFVFRYFTSPFGEKQMLTSSNAKDIGYSRVVERREDRNGIALGKTEYNFINEIQTYDECSAMITNIPLNNGLLTKKIDYNNDNKEVYRQENIYSKFNDNRYSYGLSIFFHDENPDDIRGNLYRYATFRDYKVKSEWWHLNETKEYFAHIDGLNKLEILTSDEIDRIEESLGEYVPNPILYKRTNYEYDNDKSYQPTKTIVKTSKEETIETVVHYPDDIDNENSLTLGGPLTFEEFEAIERLKLSGLDYQPASNVQTETTINGSTVTQRNHYQIFQLGEKGSEFDTSLIKGVSTAINNKPLERQITYAQYDSYGNPRELVREDGLHMIYIWGYKGEHLIAKIENAIFNSLPSNLKGNNGLFKEATNLSNDHTNVTAEMQLLGKLNEIRNHTALKDAMITTYTYDPLIGMTSTTDPSGYTTSYTYDTHNRLHQVKDNEGHVTSENKYNYKN